MSMIQDRVVKSVLRPLEHDVITQYDALIRLEEEIYDAECDLPCLQGNDKYPLEMVREQMLLKQRRAAAKVLGLSALESAMAEAVRTHQSGRAHLLDFAEKLLEEDALLLDLLEAREVMEKELGTLPISIRLIRLYISQYVGRLRNFIDADDLSLYDPE